MAMMGTTTAAVMKSGTKDDKRNLGQKCYEMRFGTVPALKILNKVYGNGLAITRGETVLI